MFLYVGPPVDFWNGWQSAEEAQAEREAGGWENAALQVKSEEYDAAWEQARALARKAGWEGDIIQGVYVSGLPLPDAIDSALVLGWKQSNNGTTFIASPVRLHYLETAGWHVERD